MRSAPGQQAREHHRASSHDDAPGATGLPSDERDENPPADAGRAEPVLDPRSPYQPL
jgi:hypothetical protein